MAIVLWYFFHYTWFEISDLVHSYYFLLNSESYFLNDHQILSTNTKQVSNRGLRFYLIIKFN